MGPRRLIPDQNIQLFGRSLPLVRPRQLHDSIQLPGCGIRKLTICLQPGKLLPNIIQQIDAAGSHGRVQRIGGAERFGRSKVRGAATSAEDN